MKIIQSENGHLWYLLDEDGKIVRVALYKENLEYYLEFGDE